VIGLPAWVAGRRPRRTFLRAAVLVLAAVVVFRWVLIPVRGAGISMTPTIADGQLVLVNRLAYRLRSPRRADIVAVRLAGRSIVYVKRVIALPGERLRIRAGIVDGRGRTTPSTSGPASTSSSATIGECRSTCTNWVACARSA
jgi:signal peptidase I